MRTPLKPGTVITMPNGAAYTIGEVIGEGGFSIVYRARTAGGNAEVVIKEFYPAARDGYRLTARRDENGVVRSEPDFQERFDRLRARFDSEGDIGGRVAGETYQVIPFLASGNGYALMQRESSDMTAVSALVASWSQLKPLPYSGREEDGDPCFTGLVRVGYALRVVDSLLSGLHSIHRRGYLHLDLSATNVLWAGREQQTGRNCAVLLTDFGCAAPMTDGAYMPEQPLSFSPGFDAPEVQRGHEPLTPATDIYSVGVLLLYLCCGTDALDLRRSRLPSRFTQQLLGSLVIPAAVRAELHALISKATSRLQASRHASAADMQADVRNLLGMLPAHPVNPDASDAFTLYSLKSMLEGSLDTRYGWADELCDRRGKTRSELPEGLHEPLSDREFSGDEDFLRALLPDAALCLVQDSVAAGQIASMRSVMTGSYPASLRQALLRKLRRIGMRELIQRCHALLDNEHQLDADADALWALLGDDGSHLRDCMQRIHARVNRAAGLAMLALYALLGKDAFFQMTDSADKVNELFPKGALQ